MNPFMQQLMGMIQARRDGGIGGGMTPPGMGGLFGRSGNFSPGWAGMFKNRGIPQMRNGALPVRGRSAYPRLNTPAPMGVPAPTPSNNGGNTAAADVFNVRPSFTNPNGNLRIGNSNRNVGW